MKNLNRVNNFSFTAIAIAVIIIAGLALGVSIPAIKDWQLKNVDKLLEEASGTNDQSTKLGLLAQAALLGKNDPLATDRYSQNLWQAGEYKSAIQAYQESLLNVNPSYLGVLALKANEPNRAKGFFEQSNREEENDEALSGLAIVEFINNNPTKGCEYAYKSRKLNLSSKQAELAGKICEISQNKSYLNTRQQAYTKLDAFMYTQALDELQKLPTKNVSDWIAIAKIHANTGNLTAAIDSLKSANSQSPENSQVMKLLIAYLNADNRGGETQIYIDRLNELQFKNYQGK